MAKIIIISIIITAVLITAGLATGLLVVNETKETETGNTNTVIGTNTTTTTEDEKSLASLIGRTPTEWSGTITDVCDNKIRETALTVVFTPTSATAGTWTSNPVNVFRTSDICVGADIRPRGTYSGSYEITAETLLGSAIKQPGGSSLIVGGTVIPEVTADGMTIVDYQNIPHTVLTLTKD